MTNILDQNTTLIITVVKIFAVKLPRQVSSGFKVLLASILLRRLPLPLPLALPLAGSASAFGSASGCSGWLCLCLWLCLFFLVMAPSVIRLTLRYSV